jgi:hypothetical protein
MHPAKDDNDITDSLVKDQPLYHLAMPVALARQHADPRNLGQGWHSGSNIILKHCIKNKCHSEQDSGSMEAGPASKHL